MVVDAVRTAFDRVRKTDYAWNAPYDAKALFAAMQNVMSDLGIESPGERGTFGSSAITQVLVAIEAGRAAIPYPTLETLLWSNLSSRLEIGEVDLPAQVTQPSIAASATPASDALRVAASHVPFAADSDSVAIAVPAADDRPAGVYLLPLGEAGLVVRSSVDESYPLYDIVVGRGLENFPFLPFHGGQEDFKAYERHRALIAAAEMAGVGMRLLEITSEYLRTREQFGKPLGSNQVLKHVLADDLVAMRSLHATLVYAAAALDAEAPEGLELAWAAKHLAGKQGHELANHMLQLHGAIGYTMELELQRYLRRMFALTAMYASTYESGEALFREFSN